MKNTGRGFAIDTRRRIVVNGSAEYGYDSSQANLDVRLNPTSGLIYVNNYYVDTTATPCKPGNVVGWP